MNQIPSSHPEGLMAILREKKFGKKKFQNFQSFFITSIWFYVDSHEFLIAFLGYYILGLIEEKRRNFETAKILLEKVKPWPNIILHPGIWLKIIKNLYSPFDFI